MIRTEKLTKKFKNIKAVDEIDLVIPKGEICGFLGLNGAGKTTTIKMLSMLLKPDSGKILFENNNLIDVKEEFLSKTGIMLENMSFYEELTAFENLKYLSEIKKNISNKRIVEVLEIVGLIDSLSKKVSDLSKGMKQRLSFAFSLLSDPQLLILDEPTSGLDPGGRYHIRQLLKELNNKGKTILLSTHLLSEAEELCTYFSIIDRGKMISQGNSEKLLSEAGYRCEIVVNKNEETISILKKYEWISKIEFERNKIIFEIMKGHSSNEINKLLIDSNIAVSSIGIKRTLENYFMNITK